MKFTKEEIALCKKIAEKHRKEIDEGDWVVLYWESKIGESWVFSVDHIERDDKTDKPICIKKWDGDHKMMSIGFDEVLLLWQISDCLEFFQERALYLDGLSQIDEEEYMCIICETDELGVVKNQASVKTLEGKTPLEALLKAVLAVLEEK